MMKLKAKMGHYSSVVGNSVHLIGEDGRFLGQIAFMCQDDRLRDRDVQTRLSRIICDAVNAGAAPAVPDDVAGSLADYDAGLLNDFGGGDVGWWQDYLRAEIGRANDFWRVQAEAQAAELARLQGKLRMIVSHATMGTTDGEGQSTNDICVQITALRNELYQDAKAAALTQPTGDRT